MLTGPAALAQVPFDMTPELYLRETPVERPEPEPVPPVEIPTSASTKLEKHILPQTGIRFEGEVGTRAFDVYLTPEQAGAPAHLELSLLNSIVVAPEYSELVVTINGTELAATPIAYVDGPSPIAIEVPPGVLTTGRNRIEIAANQRHRTDCSVSSTYELWTEIHGTGTVLELQGEKLGRIAQLDQLPAIGLNANGATELRFFVPQLDIPEARTAALRLAQHLALALKAPAVEITLIEDFEEMPATGALTIILGTAGSLPEPVAELSGQAGSGPLAGVVGQESLPNTIVVSGPDWGAVEVAARSIGALAQPPDGNLGGMRVDLADAVPVITGRSIIPLSELGVDTVEFNGRRYHTALRFALPADFYANMYSEAELFLDAAYSAAVLPGSQLDIYVNGQIAAVVPFLRLEGGTFRNSRLRIPMTNFRPGINELHVETILLTGEDEICPPGLSGRAAPRFLFSADSQLAFPEFGRIAQYPDLSALAGTGAPYADGVGVPIALAGGDSSVRSAMMLLSRLALSSGRVIETTVVDAQALNPAENALIVGPMTALPSDLLARGRIVGLDATGAVPVLGSGEDALERWQESAGVSSNNVVERFQNWLADQLDLAPENFWLFRRADGAYLPQSPDAVVLSQAYQPQGGVWTLLTIPDGQMFAEATARLVSADAWNQVAGRISAVAPEDEEVLVLQPRNRMLVRTEPLSFTNMRLIAANWLSTNVLGYAVVLGIAAVLLTSATSLLLGQGRRRK